MPDPNILSCEELEELLVARNQNVVHYVNMLNVLVPALEQIRDGVENPQMVAAKALKDMDRAVVKTIALPTL